LNIGKTRRSKSSCRRSAQFTAWSRVLVTAQVPRPYIVPCTFSCRESRTDSRGSQRSISHMLAYLETSTLPIAVSTIRFSIRSEAEARKLEEIVEVAAKVLQSLRLDGCKSFLRKSSDSSSRGVCGMNLISHSRNMRPVIVGFSRLQDFHTMSNTDYRENSRTMERTLLKF
jgi:hypothetical protein